jgi:hypothetical protein
LPDRNAAYIKEQLFSRCDRAEPAFPQTAARLSNRQNGFLNREAFEASGDRISDRNYAQQS